MKVNPINLLGRDEKLSRTYSEKLSRIKIDKKLTFEEHIKGLCKKSQSKSSYAGKNFIFHEI